MKIIHTADIHLGARPDPGYAWSREREQEIWNSFRRLIERVKEERADFLLVAGDLFHRQPLLRELKEVNYLFASIPETTVVLMAGNHDYLAGNSCYPGFPWSRNVIGLWDERCRRVPVPGKDTCVYGCSYHSREVCENLYRGARPQGRETFHILVAHGGDGKHSPLDFRELEAAGFTYAALGHIHRPEIFPGGRAAYAGALEPIDRNDEGPHGYIRVVCKGDGVRTEFVPFAVRSYRKLELPVKPETTQFELEETVREEIRRSGAGNLFKLRLTGLRDPETEFSLERLKRMDRVLQATDETEPAWDFRELSEKFRGSLIGEFVDYFDGKETETERKALYYGVEALLKAKRDI